MEFWIHCLHLTTLCIFVYVWVYMYHDSAVQAKGQLLVVSLLLSPSGSPRASSDHQLGNKLKI